MYQLVPLHFSMEWYLVKCLMLVLMVMLQIHGHKGCLEEERMGLLEFKAFLKSNGADADHLLPSWVDDRESDCCAWERVTCNTTTGHVMDLFLNNTKQEFYEVDTIWFLNVSLFRPFKELRSLDLSYNWFGGWTKNEGFERLSNLKKLEILDLGSNKFDNNSILQSLGALTSLKTLILSYNGLGGYFPVKELATLNSLEVLILSGNYLNGTLPIQDLVTFSNLEILDLRMNDFSGSIPPFIGALSSLKALSLSFNKLNDSLPVQGLCELKKLEELDLRHNFFDGILPQCLNSLTSLRLLDLSLNQFTGNISSNSIANLTSVHHIDFSHNSFKGSFSFSSFANHSKLEVIKFISDNDEFEIETELSGWVPMFQLKVLVLSNCNLNKLTGDVPKFLLNQYELKVVDLSHNNLKGRFPNWLLKNNTRLEFLNLRNNSFMGQFYLPSYPIIAYWIDVSDNQVGGQLQENIGEMIPKTIYLNLSRNTFEGSIPASICEMSKLNKLDLSTNKLSGEVPKQLVASGCTKLNVLKLLNNSFHGQILSEDFNLTSITDLHLDNNQFTGTLSNVISNFGLYVLDISNNYMSGEIHGLGYMELITLVMRNNSFEGQFPCELVPYKFLDLSHNSFLGSLPCCSNLQYLEHIHLQNNKFTGSIPKAFLNSSYLVTLDIRDNFLSGSIPNLITGLSNLRVLVLRGNHFSGLIPYQLCQLNKIGLMDLSKNSFYGPIPHCFNNITFGKTRVSDHVFAQAVSWSGNLVESSSSIHDTEDGYDEQDEVEFVTKYRPSSYKGDILNYMSGLDLSCNKLTGEIPHELGKLSWIHALNLSHNQLTGSIPSTFSNLTQVESLDLSYNNLSGEIPSELIDLHFLAVFTVAQNNLSGKVPDMKGQFGTFENSSYDGNLFLCGPPLEKKCTTVVESPNSPTASLDEREGKWYEIDPLVFSASFAASYIMFLLGVATLLYINPHWRQRWFNLIEECFYSCYYFVFDTLYKL